MNIEDKDNYLGKNIVPQNEATHSSTLVSTLTDTNIISPQEHQERFASAPKILHDTFLLQDDGSFLIQTPEKSQVMDGHLRNIPIVPGVVLKKLFFHQTQNKAKGIVTTQFLGGAFAGQKIIVRHDGIFTPAGKKLVDICTDTQEQILSPDHHHEKAYKKMEQDFDDFLLQKGAFRFVDNGEKTGVMKDDTDFRGTYTIPEDFIRSEKGIINSELLEEIAAQLGTYLVGPDLNKNMSLITKTENNIQLNGESKILTFKVGKSLATDIPAQVGETIFIQGKILTFSPEGKEAHFCYTIKNKDNQLLLSGEIKGTILPIKMLMRAYEKTKHIEK